MKVKVLKSFTDKHDRQLKYAKEQIINIEENRIKELNSTKHGKIVEIMKETRDYPFPKNTGGGWFLLSNNEKVQGKEESEKKEAELRS